MNHVTRIAATAGRRINDRRGRRENLCGGVLTDRDLSIGDARRALRLGDLDRWLDCPDCRAAVHGMSGGR